jgi:regulator of cell morphogenesis and NO signaling
MVMENAGENEEADMAATAAAAWIETRGEIRGPLAAPAAADPGQRWTRTPGPLPDAALVAHLVEHHHDYVRRSLQYVVPLLAKVAGFYGRRYEKLNALCDAGQELAEVLEAHLEEEERTLFPALLADPPARDALRRALDDMAQDHLRIELLFARVRMLADGYDAPIWAGRSHEVLLEELEALEENVVEHMHLESYVLVPRLASGANRSLSARAA